jgi:hypothetical protein
MPAIFLSHSSRDNAIVDQIKGWLARLGFEQVFVDFENLKVGENWEKRLYAEIARCHAVLLVITPHWIASKWCFAELTTSRAIGKIILPVICAPVGDDRVLAEIQAADLVDWNPDGLKRVEQRLRAITQELARGFAFPANRSPYPGIRAFDQEDVAIYFGRDEETRALIERLDARRIRGATRLVLIVGASGAGKSSLLKAGLIPQLTRRKREWIVLPAMRPERTPLESLAKTIVQHLGTPAAWEDWHARLCRPEAIDDISRLARTLRIGDASQATLLFPIDQFEEVFTIAEANERDTFLRLLAAVLDPELGLPVMVAATGRADILQSLLEGSAIAATIETVFLLPMPLDRVPRLIEGPAAVAGLSLEKGLANEIAGDVSTPDALPLLATTLALLYARCASDKHLTLAAYRALGDGRLNPIQNSVRRAADEAFGGRRLSVEERDALRDAFIPHLVSLRLDDGKRVRQPARRADLPRESEPLVNALINARLLSVRSEERTDGSSDAVVEVAHEALFEAWPLLKDWLDKEPDFLADLARLRIAHAAWSNASVRDKPSALLRGLLLSRPREWLAQHPRDRLRGRPSGDFISNRGNGSGTRPRSRLQSW